MESQRVGHNWATFTPWDSSLFIALATYTQMTFKSCLYTRHPLLCRFIQVPNEHLHTNIPWELLIQCPKPHVHPSHTWTFPTFPIIVDDIAMHPIARTRTLDPSLTSHFSIPPAQSLSSTDCLYEISFGFILPFLSHYNSHCIFLRRLVSKVSCLGFVVYCLFVVLLIWGLCSLAFLTDCGNSGFSKIHID